MAELILASQSPRRQELLRRIGLQDFTVLVSEADEAYDPAGAPGGGRYERWCSWRTPPSAPTTPD